MRTLVPPSPLPEHYAVELPMGGLGAPATGVRRGSWSRRREVPDGKHGRQGCCRVC